MAVEQSTKQWFPLESNPEVMNEYMGKLGFDTTKYGFTDVFGTEDWAIDMVPQPVVAVSFLYPITAAAEAHREAEAAKIEADGQVVSDKLVYMKQFVGNACGTVAIVHAAANAADVCPPAAGSFLARFVAEAPGKDAEALGRLLEESPDLEEAHVEAAEAGQSSVPEDDESVDTHFVAFVHKEGHLYELDGRKGSAINHGPTTPATLLKDACGVIKQFMARDPDEVRFTILALAPVQSA